MTHSDTAAELFLTIGADYDRKRVAGLRTRLTRDEAPAKWTAGAAGPALDIFCQVSGGLVFGGAAMRDAIFRRELPLVCGAFPRGDRMLFAAHLQFDRAAVIAHFRSHLARYNRVEKWGVPADYRFKGTVK